MPGEVSASPHAEAQVNGIVQEDAAKNRVPVHTFDPNAPPEEKAAAAGKGKDKLKRDGGDEGTVEKGALSCEQAWVDHGWARIAQRALRSLSSGARRP